MRRFIGRAPLLALAVAGALATDASAGARCSRQELMQGADKVDALKTWADVYAFYKYVDHCNDVSVSEGVSDVVAGLLAREWDQLAIVTAYIRKDPGFETYVVSQLGEIVGFEEAKAIRANATRRCPRDASNFCKRMVAELDF